MLLIIGGSVSSGYSGKPIGEWIAEWTATPFRNEARICQPFQKIAADFDAGDADIVFALDAFYWDSYGAAGKAVAGVERFFAKTRGVKVVIATVPDRNAGWFYRTFCGAEGSEQVSREAINEAIKRGCGANCLLLDADELYHRPALEGMDIHLTPDIWRSTAQDVMLRMEGKWR